jgi:hypothetical protein
MAKLSRYFLTIFGASGPTDDFEKFGSARAGAPIKTKDIPTIQQLAAWATGLKAGIITDNRAPFLESMNAILYLVSFMQAYMFQEGLPEWDSQTTYYTGSIVKKAGTRELYISRTDNNLNQALPTKTDNASWTYFNHSMEAPGMIKAYAGAVAPSGYLLCDGSEVGRAAYPDLFATIGTAWGAGDGSTTFNLPDLRGKSLFGKAAAGTFATLGASGGAETHGHEGSTVSEADPINVSDKSSEPHIAPVARVGVISIARETGGGWPGGYVGFGAPTRETASGLADNNQGTFCLTIPNGTHFHTLPKHAHGLTIATKSHLPPYAVVNYIIKY